MNNKAIEEIEDVEKEIASKEINNIISTANNINTEETTIKCARNTFSSDEIQEVILRIYDISDNNTKMMFENIFGMKIDGIWHTSIEIFGKEYYFQGGLFACRPGKSQFGECKEKLNLGKTDCSKESLEEFFEASKTDWTNESYDLFENNCNNFTDYLSNFLLNKGIPDYILDLPKKIKENDRFKNIFNKF